MAHCKQTIESGVRDKQVEVLTVKIDLSDSSEENYRNVGKQIDPDDRDIGILINNAGLATNDMRNFHEFDTREFVEIANVNVLAMLHFTKMVLPGMINRGRGCIINVSSLLGCIESPHANIYGPSKAFVNRFTSNLQIEYKSFPIDIFNLTPGCVQTKMLHGASQNSLINMETFLAPSAEYYSRSVVNAISTRIPRFSGCFGHALSMFGVKLLQSVGLNRLFFKATFNYSASNYDPKTIHRLQKIPQINLDLKE